MVETGAGPKLAVDLVERVFTTAERTGDHTGAARRLEELATTGRDDELTRAEVFAAAGHQWLLAERPGDALRCWRRAREHGGELAGEIRALMARGLFLLGEDDAARALLAEVAAERPADPAVYLTAGEALEEHGDAKAALEWYARGVVRQLRDLGLDTGEPDLDGLLDTGPEPEFFDLLQARARVRQRLGFTPDRYDELAALMEEALLSAGFEDWDGYWDGDAADFGGPPADDLPAGPGLLYWPAPEFATLLRRWPDAATWYGVDHAEHRRRVERMLREYAGQGTAVLPAPGSVAGLEAYAAAQGSSPADAEVRAGYARDLTRRGAGLPWPPERNTPCWCGSGAKYKKCCGHPANR